MSSSLQSFSSSSFIKSEISFQSEDRLILPKIANKSTDDTRFQGLIDLFVNVQKKDLSTNRSVQTIIQSKPSLQKRQSIVVFEDNTTNTTLFDAYV